MSGFEAGVTGYKALRMVRAVFWMVFVMALPNSGSHRGLGLPFAVKSRGKVHLPTPNHRTIPDLRPGQTGQVLRVLPNFDLQHLGR